MPQHPAKAPNPRWQQLATAHGPPAAAASQLQPPRPVQGKLTVSEPGDPYEREADDLAERVMSGAEPAALSAAPAGVQRKCSACAAEEAEEAQARPVRTKRLPSAPVAAAAASSRDGTDVSAATAARIEGMRGSGQPLASETRAFYEQRFGHDFSQVRTHTGAPAAEAARELGAQAFTVGEDIGFATSQYAPDTAAGRRLLAHELAHVLQQRAGSERVQRQAVRGSGAASAPACGGPPHCPPAFCTPFPGGALAASAARTAMAPVLLAGIAVAVNRRVVPLWNQYLFGGAPPQDLSSQFGADFTASATTARTTDFLVRELKQDIEAHPPAFPAGVNVVTVDLSARIPTALADIGTADDPHEMNFNVIGEIPGNIAGGISKDQAACPTGAMPSPFDDSRTATGTAEVTKNPDGSLTIVPTITFTVQDTIDLCPGNCGAQREQHATVPMSRFEAAGVSGDVPFTVRFEAPPRRVVAHPATPPSPPSAAGPVSGRVTASVLHIRAAANTSSAILGRYPRGTAISILCQTRGETIEGSDTWDKTDRGFVSDRYVSRGAGTPPGC